MGRYHRHNPDYDLGDEMYEKAIEAMRREKYGTKPERAMRELRPEPGFPTEAEEERLAGDSE